MCPANCPDREQLQAYAAGRISDQTADTLADHIDECTDCQAALETIDDAEDSLVVRLRRAPAREKYQDESQYEEAMARAAAAAEDAFQPGGKQTSDGTVPTPDLKQVGEYELLEKLGQGGMGMVYRALQTKLQRVVALKLLSKNRMDDEKAVARFDREMVAIGGLDHPNIVRATHAGEHEGNSYLVMDYVDGLDLSEIARRCGPLPVSDVCELVRQAALGLQYVHEHGLVHRDIKPSNLMLTSHGQVKVLDLGLALLQEDQPTDGDVTADGQPMGTADYIAPEQASDSHHVDIRADVYSLGCTLYRLLAGRPPYVGPQYKNAFEKMMGHARDPVPSITEVRDDLPERLVELVQRMLSKDPNERPATPSVVAEAMRPFARGADLPQLIDWAETHAVSPAADTVTCDGASVPAADGTEEYVSSAVVVSEPDAVSDVAPYAHYRQSHPSARRWHRRPAALVALAVAGVLALAAIIVVATNRGTLEIKTYDDDVRVSIIRNGEQVTILDTNTGSKLTLYAGDYELKLSGGGAGLELKRHRITMRRGETIIVEVVRKPTRQAVPPSELIAAKFSPEGELLNAQTQFSNLSPLVDSASDAVVGRWWVERGELRAALGGAPYKRITIPVVPVGSYQLRVQFTRTAGNRDVGVMLPAGSGSTMLALSTFSGAASGLQNVRGGHARENDTARSGSLSNGVPHTLLITVRLPSDQADVDVKLNDRPYIAWKGPQSMLSQNNTWRMPHPEAFGLGVDATVVFHSVELKMLDGSARSLQTHLPPHPTLLATLRGHTACVRSVAVSPKGKTLATASYDGTLKLWDMALRKELATLRGHTDQINCVVFSSDGKTLASAGLQDKVVKLWDVATGKVLHSLEGHTGRVFFTAFAPDGSTVASASEDGTVIVWDVAKGTELATLEGHAQEVEVVTFSPDGKLLASGNWDGTVKLWNVGTWKEQATLRVDTPIRSVTFSPDGKTLASGSVGGAINLWDIATRKARTAWQAHERAVRGLAFTPDGKTLASSSPDGTFRIWDASTGEILASHRENQWIWSIAFSRDGLTLLTASHDSTVKLWDVASLLLAGTTPTDRLLPNGWVIHQPDNLGSAVNSRFDDSQPTLSTDGLTLLFTSLRPGGQGGEDLWMSTRTSVNEPFAAPSNLGPTINSTFNDSHPVLSVDGLTLLLGSNRPGGVGMHDLWMCTRTSSRELFGKPVNLGPNVNSAVIDDSPALSSDGLALAFQSRRPGKPEEEPNLWMSTRESRSKLFGKPVKLGPTVNSGAKAINPAFSTDGLTLLFCSVRPPTPGIHDLWMSTRTSLSGPFGKPIHLGPIVNSSYYDGSPTLSADGRTLLFDSNRPGGQGGFDLWMARIEQRHPPDEVRRFEGHTKRVVSLAFSPDGRYAVSGSYDLTVRLWDVASGKELRQFNGQPRPGRRREPIVFAVAFSPDGRRVLTGSQEPTIRLWDVETGEELLCIEGHEPGMAIDQVAFSPDGRRALSCAWDRSLLLWDLETGEELGRIDQSKTMLCATFLPDGDRILCGASDGNLYLFDMKTEQEIRRFEGHASGNSRMALSPDGRSAVSVATSSAKSSMPDKTVRLWDVETGGEVRRFEGHTDRLSDVAFSTDGRRVFSASDDGTVRLWDVGSGEEIHRFDCTAAPIAHLALSPDGQHLLVAGAGQPADNKPGLDGDYAIRLWRLQPTAAEQSAGPTTSSPE